MTKTIIYGVLVAGVIIGAVILSADLVFAAPVDEIDYSYVEGSAIGTLTCPDQSEHSSYGLNFRYSEKDTSDFFRVLQQLSLFGPDGGNNQQGVLTSGFVTKDDFAIRGTSDSLLECDPDFDINPIVVTLVGECGFDATTILTTNTGTTATFVGYVACS